MTAHLRPALVLLVLFTLLTGLAYPLAITGIAQAVFPSQANGSLIERNGKVVGSALIGQAFTARSTFWPRPSATSAADPNDPTKTCRALQRRGVVGLEPGPTSKDLVDRVTEDVAASARRAPAASRSRPTR